jgi:hypothetical protein
MATQVQFRRGTTTQNNAFTGAIGELTVDTDVKTIRLHDGSTPGGGAILINANAAQTLTNKTLSTNSVWNGAPVAIGFGGTGYALTPVAGSVAYGTASGISLTAAGSSGQILTSAGTGTPAWVSPSAINVGTATTAINANNVTGGSAGYLVYQADTSTTSFIAPGAAGTFLRSTGASTPPNWATSNVTIGSTAIDLGSSTTSLAGLNILASTGTSHWTLPAGTTAQRPGTPTTGMVRYNSTLSTFEGYAASSWGSLGGVKSVDGFTYILAETSAGASNGDLDFWAENAGGTAAQQVGQWNRTNLKDYTGTLVGTQTTQNVFNATATTVNAFGAATAITLGASTGTLSLQNATVNMAGAATVGTTLSVGGNTAINGSSVTTTSTSMSLFNTNATTVNAFGAATTLNIGGASGTTTVGNNLVITGNLTVNGTQVIENTTTMEVSDPMIYIGTGNSGNSNDIGFVGHFTSGTYQHTGLVRDASDAGKWKLFSGMSTEPSNAVLDFTTWTKDTLVLGGLEATSVTNSGNETIGGTLGVTGATTLSSTLGVTGAATLSSTLAVTGASTLTGDVAANSGTITTTATTGNLFNATATTLNIGGAATALTIGATTGTATIRNATVAITNNATVGGTLAVTGNQTNTGDIAVNGGDVTTTATIATVFNTNATTVNAFGAATTLSIGATTGTLTLNNANTIISGNLTVNGTTTTVNSSTVNLDNTILQLGGDTLPIVDDNQDRGVAFRWHNGTTAKNGFFGYHDLTGFFTFIPDATITAGVASGTLGVIDAARITGSAASLTTGRAINGTTFDGTGPITTATWGTARTITLGATGKSVDGSAAVSWTIPEIIPTTTNLQLNSLGIGTAASGTAGEIRATGAITGYYSDGRLKENIVEIENAVEKVMGLRGVTFNANDIAESFGYTREEQVGVIAQDVEKVLPQIVKPAPFDLIRIDENTEISRSGENYKTVQYEKLVPLLIQAIKEQQMMIEELQKKVG